MAGSDYSEEAETPACGRHCRGGFETLPYGAPSTHGVQEFVFPTARPIPLADNAG